VIGGSYTGLEMAQFYRRMGSQVTVIDASERIPKNEDEDVCGAIQRFLASEGIGFRLGARATEVRAQAKTRIELGLRGSRSSRRTFSHLFIATGRQPNTDDLGLETIGLRLAKDGTVPTDKRLATRVPGVWAAGDIRGGAMFTHTAWDDHRVLLSQLASDGSRTTERFIPYAIFTDPQLGRVGLTEGEAKKLRRPLRLGHYAMKNNGKAKEIGETGGFIKVIADARSRRILGAAVLAAEGAELVHIIVDVMNARSPYNTIGEAIHIHPTLAEAVQSAVTAIA
jgi:pyruvate/2-oxoglutarate dehydrogenase complex dihydrolipoamide dehydrogenase (E3) component